MTDEGRKGGPVKGPKGLDSAIPDVHWTRALYYFFPVRSKLLLLEATMWELESSRDVALTVLTLDTYVRVTCKKTHT